MKGTIGIRALLASTILATFSFWSQPGLADGAAADDGLDDLQEIVVTAQKKSERLMDVPASIAVVNTQSLLQTNSTQLRDFYAQVPGLNVTSSGNGRTTIAIRGITTGGGNNPTVGLTIDDVPIGSATSSGLGDAVVPEIDPSSLQQIEVLRGPQGSLYGASSMGGLIRYVTAAPSLTETFGQVAVSGSTVAHGGEGGGGRAYINVPLVEDKLGLRVSAFARMDPGYMTNVNSGQTEINVNRTEGGRATLLWQITPSVSYQASATYQHMTAGGSSNEYVTVNRQTLYGDYTQAPIAGLNTGYLDMGIYNGNLKADLGFANLVAVTSYSHTVFNGPQDTTGTFGRYLGFFFPSSALPSLGTGIYNYYQTNKISQEVRLESQPGGMIDWMVGGFATNEDNLNRQNVYVADKSNGQNVGFPDLYTVFGPSHYREYAGFGSATYHFDDKLDFTFGGRYSRQFQENASEVGGVLQGDTSYSDLHSNTSVFTYSLGPQYHISPNMMVYGRVSTGYRPGGPNDAPGEPAAYNSDTTTNYEVGFKGVLVDRLLTVDAALFDIEWDDIQLQAASPTGFSYIQNGGTARSRGAELTLTLTPSEGLSVVANLGYTDATLTENIKTSGLYGLKGQRLPYSAKFSGSLSADQKFRIMDGFTGFVGGTVSYMGDRYSVFPTKSTGQRFFMPSYATVDVRAGVTHDDWNLSVYGKNLGSEIAFISGGPLDTITRTGTYSAAIIQPRTFGVTISKDF
ncbi:TonB-dependent receptor [Nitrospirillum iridis]|uniref:Outer membrane receptor protein involved in Fe transport n=1 Tax=Nitrospirillum iridis TaxID=765888 RepID=A0A7X0AVF1_9PROT|nr:TonB-dependent receptor [Nitrospirillum iridis]MBB6250838.1 outer membrane receptor protein involved in Fe transport [Nitrospirillum iridis]